MPIYTFECRDCAKQFDSYVAAAEMSVGHREPCDCGGAGVRIFLPPQINTGFKPYATPHFDGEMRYVSSQSEEDRLCRENRVRRATESDMEKPKKRNHAPATPLWDDFQRTRNDIKYGNLNPAEVNPKKGQKLPGEPLCL